MVEASSTVADLTMPQKGAIRVTATDAGSSAPLPVRVQVIPEAGAFQPPDNFGEPVVPRDDRLHVVFPADGKALLSAPAGDHRVVLSVADAQGGKATQEFVLPVRLNTSGTDEPAAID